MREGIISSGRVELERLRREKRVGMIDGEDLVLMKRGCGTVRGGAGEAHGLVWEQKRTLHSLI